MDVMKQSKKNVFKGFISTSMYMVNEGLFKVIDGSVTKDMDISAVFVSSNDKLQDNSILNPYIMM